MAAPKIRTGIALGSFPRPPYTLPRYRCVFCKEGQFSSRRFATSARLGKDGSNNNNNNGSFGSRLRTALRKTKIEWKPIPVALGIGFLGAVQFYRVREREKRRQEEDKDKAEEEEKHKPKKRKRIRPSGPWYVNLFGLIKLRKSQLLLMEM